MTDENLDWFSLLSSTATRDVILPRKYVYSMQIKINIIITIMTNLDPSFDMRGVGSKLGLLVLLVGAAVGSKLGVIDKL
jgi:hypothetical protein